MSFYLLGSMALMLAGAVLVIGPLMQVRQLRRLQSHLHQIAIEVKNEQVVPVLVRSRFVWTEFRPVIAYRYESHRGRHDSDRLFAMGEISYEKESDAVAHLMALRQVSVGYFDTRQPDWACLIPDMTPALKKHVKGTVAGGVVVATAGILLLVARAINVL